MKSYTRARTSLMALLTLAWLLAACPALAGDRWRLESHTRYDVTLTRPGEPALQCGDDADKACLEHDLLQILSASLGASDQPGLSSQVTLRYRYSAGDQFLRDLSDTYGATGDLKVLGLTLSWADRSNTVRIMAGRQSYWDSDPLLFDGISATARLRGDRAWKNAVLTAYGGLYTALDADGRTEALFGALFPQERVGEAEVVADVPLFGIDASWSPTWHNTIMLSDTFYQGVNHLRVGSRQRIGSAAGVHLELRTLGAAPRDLRIGADYLDLRSGSSAFLTYQKVFTVDYGFRPIDEPLYASGSGRLLIGAFQPYHRLLLIGYRPLIPAVTLSLRGGGAFLDEPEQQSGFQRNIFEVGAGLIARPGGRFRASLEALEIIAPDVGTYQDGGDVVQVIDENDTLEINTFPNLTGEGEALLTELTAGIDLRTGARTRLKGGASILVVHRYQTQIVTALNWASYRAWLGSQLTVRSWLDLNLRYLLEQDLHYAIGTVGNIHQFHVGARASF